MNPPLRVLVTGAAGFIGGHLARYLAARGYGVRALVHHAPPQGLEGAGVELARGDIIDPGAMRAAVDGVDAICHLAAVRDAWGTPESIYQAVNVEGTRHLLEAAAVEGVERFVYCSSVGVARDPGNLAADETLPYSEPSSQVLYHCTKARAERLVLDYARSGRVPAVVVRPVIAYGPGDETGFVTQLIALLARGPLVWVGNGRNHVNLVYIDDLVAGMGAALEKGVVGRVYIFSGTTPIQVRALVEQICGLLDQRAPRVRVPVGVARAAGWGMEMLYHARNRLGLNLDGSEPFITRDKVATLTVDRGFSHARAKRELDYEPRIGYDEGLRHTLAWWRRVSE